MLQAFVSSSHLIRFGQKKPKLLVPQKDSTADQKVCSVQLSQFVCHCNLAKFWQVQDLFLEHILEMSRYQNFSERGTLWGN